jgi:hypothetical protein
MLGMLEPSATRAAAGGMDWLAPVEDRYEPGETVTMVGYTVRRTWDYGDADGDSNNLDVLDADVLDWSDTGPFHAYLRDPDSARQASVAPGDLDLGEPTVSATDHGDDFENFAVRVAVTFTVPADLAPGEYIVYITDQTGTRNLGNVGDSPVYVGVDPGYELVRTWPLDEPAIADMADDARVYDVWSGLTVTAADIRRGELPTRTWPTEQATPTSRPTATTDRSVPNDDASRTDVATGPAPAGGDGSDLGGILPGLIAFAALIGLWCLAWRIRSGPDRPPRKQVTAASGAPDTSGTSGTPRTAGTSGTPDTPVTPGVDEVDDEPALPSGRPLRIRL